MRSYLPIAAVCLLLAGCGSRDDQAEPGTRPDEAPGAPPPAAAAPAATADRWDLQSSGEGTALALLSASGATRLRLFCPAGGKRIVVNVPGFRAVGSEERLSFGSGGNVEALVADARGDAQRGGVSGAGAVPATLAALLAGPVAVNYGAQNSGPHPAPAAAEARAFVAACGQAAAPAQPAAEQAAASPAPCGLQDGRSIAVRPLRAVGTEPFWGARIEGRCVTYSHPDDQAGTRIWTRYAPGASGGGSWSGALGGRRFELRTRLEPGCSDGMSDKVYPIAVDLIAAGERRSGCAEPA